MKCTIEFLNGKWRLKDENGQTWCAFDEKRLVEDLAKVKQWEI